MNSIFRPDVSSAPCMLGENNPDIVEQDAAPESAALLHGLFLAIQHGYCWRYSPANRVGFAKAHVKEHKAWIQEQMLDILAGDANDGAQGCGGQQRNQSQNGAQRRLRPGGQLHQ